MTPSEKTEGRKSIKRENEEERMKCGKRSVIQRPGNSEKVLGNGKT